jgi:hypothetical protein
MCLTEIITFVALLNDILIIKPYLSKTNNLFYALSLTGYSTTSVHRPKQLHVYCDSTDFTRSYLNPTLQLLPTQLEEK